MRWNWKIKRPDWKSILIAVAVTAGAGATAAWAAQTNYLGTAFIADTTTPANQLKVNADGSINATVVGGGGGVPSIAGTANQITEVGSPGATTLSLPSDLQPPGTVTVINSDLLLLGSSTGKTTFTSDNAGATNYTLHFPAANATLATTANLGSYLPLTAGTGSPLTGMLVVNLNAVAAPTPITGTVAQYVGADSAAGFIENDTFAAAPIFTGRRADGTGASPTAVQSGDVLTGFSARPYDGTAYASASVANVQGVATENFTAAHHGADVVANCTQITTLTTAECGRFKYNGFTIPTSSIYQINGTQITTAALSDVANIGLLNTVQTWTAAQRNSVSTLAISTATFTPSFDAANNFKLTLIHASCPCTFANPSTTPVAGQTGFIQIIQSATGSDAITTWGSSYVATGGVAALTLSAGANATDVFSYLVIDSTHIVVAPGAINVTH